MGLRPPIRDLLPTGRWENARLRELQTHNLEGPVEMDETPQAPEELDVIWTRLFYDPESGQVVHMNTLVSPHGAGLDQKRIDQEAKSLEDAVAQRYEKTLKSVDISDEKILTRTLESNTAFKVDPETGQLVFEEVEATE
ncbi:hypothetical protein NicSoilB4_15080 [Arthrobacter sp. NicSoilB4]|nr:hypothetical protein NicSoilB4_15080 [Arthrobacter sp. NicSoilB4]